MSGLIPMFCYHKQFCFEAHCTYPLGNMTRVSLEIYFCQVIEFAHLQHAKKCQIIFQMFTHNHQHCVFVPLALYPFKFLVLFDILSIGNLMYVKCYPFAILICISLISSEVKHLFMYLSVNCICSFVSQVFYGIVCLLVIARNSFYVLYPCHLMCCKYIFTYLCWHLIGRGFNTVCFYYLCSFPTWLLLTGGNISWNLVHP